MHKHTYIYTYIYVDTYTRSYTLATASASSPPGSCGEPPKGSPIDSLSFGTKNDGSELEITVLHKFGQLLYDLFQFFTFVGSFRLEKKSRCAQDTDPCHRKGHVPLEIQLAQGTPPGTPQVFFGTP